MSHLIAGPKRRREAHVFARYLFGIECPEAVLAAYLRFHELYPLRISGERDWFDRLLTRWGRHRPLLILADSYAALFRPTSTLRKRLVLCLSLLECLPECDAKLQCPGPDRRIVDGAALAGRLLWQALVLLAAVPLLAPMDLIARCGRFSASGPAAGRGRSVNNSSIS